MLWQRLEKFAQHPAFGIVDSVFHGRTRTRGNPWRIADHERRATFGKKIRLHDLDAFGEPESLDVLPRTLERAWFEIGRHHAFDATPGQYRGEYSSACADIEGDAGSSARRWQRCGRDEVHVLTADRREDAEMRMNAAARFRNLDAFRAPLARADHTEQPAQRCDRCGLHRA